MLRADEPVEGDDSKETNIAVALLTTDALAKPTGPATTRSRFSTGGGTKFALYVLVNWGPNPTPAPFSPVDTGRPDFLCQYLTISN